MNSAWACAALFTAALCTDLQERVIPNTLTLSAALGGLAFHTLLSGVPGALWSVQGGLTGLACLFIPFVLGGVGGGDVKLLAATGTWVGAHALFSVFLYGAMAGGAMALVPYLRHRRSRRHGETSAVTMPYSLAMATGYAAYLLMGKVPLG
ncbi:A24 family peptidase [Desulfoluna spongiiphila]|uniref:Prepilin peptidase CpaA n=1 Tax=Desulfoluna spongiiphila TaxID=419481 RepID=A0A1G5HDV7_9BACT|nr:A24 family peptidase [Desulfoluna spongiiphila]SCY61914.1 prepilin peptidase CpaA [Desulfoluna spongiiphila]VVS94654.1 prepilin type iv endopeptidase peptidase domain [Desulfoluna spongiiphila]